LLDNSDCDDMMYLGILGPARINPARRISVNCELKGVEASQPGSFTSSEKLTMKMCGSNLNTGPMANPIGHMHVHVASLRKLNRLTS